MIAGLGSIGRRHLRNLRHLGQEDVVLLRTRTSTLPEDELAGLPVETDIHDALERWHPQGVVVANPTSKHLDVSIPAANEGCHLLIEKPVSHDLDRVEELRTAVARGGGKVLVGFQFRFHPGLREAKRLLGEGAIGRPLTARAEWGEYLPDWHSWEDYRQSYAGRAELGGGVLLTLCHPFDYLRWLLGDVQDVRAVTAKLGDLDIDVEDTAEAILFHASGAMSSVHLDYLGQPPRHRLEISGTAGSIRWDNADGAVHWWTATDRVWQVAGPPADFERNTMFIDEMRHFIAVADGLEKPACSLEEGLKVLETVEAVRKASTGGCNVQLAGQAPRQG